MKYVIKCLGSFNEPCKDKFRCVESFTQSGKLFTHIDPKKFLIFDSKESAEILILKIKAVHNFGNKFYDLKFEVVQLL